MPGVFLFERALIIETSGKLGQVAVARDGQAIACRILPEARRHARDLAALSAELLGEQNWKPSELTAVIVDIGPGSFTGLRVGLASAKVLAFATRCELVGVPAFHAVAVNVPPQPATLEIIADALQGHVYCQKFASSGLGWTPNESLRIRLFQDWLQDFEQGSLIAGPGVKLFRDRLPPTGVVVDIDGPDAASLLRVAVADPSAYVVSAWDAEPIYLRGSSAEEKRKLSQ